MNRMWLARKAYEKLQTELALRHDEQTSDQAEAWLRDQVCPVVEELLYSRSFKLAARWSLDHLTKGTETAERRQVEEVDKALVACAATLVDYTMSDSATEIGRSTGGLQRTAISDQDHFAVRWISGRPWFDLVNAEEFFHPNWDLFFHQPTSEHLDLNIGESVTQLTTAFRQRGDLRIPLGDYIQRSLFARIDFWKSILDRVWHNVHAHPMGIGQDEYLAKRRLFDAKINLDQRVADLTQTCRSGAAPRKREGAAILTQVYAAYSESPVLNWLGFPPGWGTAGRGLIRTSVRRRGQQLLVEPTGVKTARVIESRPMSLCDLNTLQQIAAGLCDVIPLYEMPEDPDDLIDWAVDRVPLVLVDRSPRAVYWDGAAVAEGAWDSCPVEWNLLWTLSQNPGRPVDQGMLTQRELARQEAGMRCNCGSPQASDNRHAVQLSRSGRENESRLSARLACKYQRQDRDGTAQSPSGMTAMTRPFDE